MPKSFIAVSREIEGKVLPFTKVNEEYIATLKIQKMLNKGKSPRQIALVWNGSLGGQEKPIEKKGINNKGVAYDTIAYARIVMGNLK